jgi:hypothetical protein
VIVNEVVTVENLGPRARGIDHFNLESSALLHDLAIDEILRAREATE